MCWSISYQLICNNCSAKSTGKDMATPLLILLVLFTDEFNFAGGMGWYVT